MSSACGPWRSRAARRRRRSRARARPDRELAARAARTSSFARWKPKISTRAPQRGEPSVGDPRAAVGRRLRSISVEVGGEAPRRRTRRTPPSSRRAAARRRCSLRRYGSSLVLRADLGGVVGQLALVARDRLRRAPARRATSGSATPTHRRAPAPRRGSAGARARAPGRAPPRSSPARRGLPSWSPPIQVPKRSGARRAGSRSPVVARAARRRVEQALLEEPEPVADLVDDPRPPRAHLVGLPEERHLLGERGSTAVARRGAASGRRARASSRASRRCACEDGAARRLGRMRRQDELERDAARPRRAAPSLDAGLPSRANASVERLARDALLVLVLAPPAQAVVLLREVRELEVEAERAQDRRLPLERQRATASASSPAGPGGRLAVPRESSRIRSSSREQPLALLLDEHPRRGCPRAGGRRGGAVPRRVA